MAMAGSALMLAHLVAGKATRDGLFLSRYPASDLPKIIAGAAVVAIVLGYLFSRALERWGPRRIVPGAYLASALAHVAEWRLIGQQTGVEALIYLHIVGVGAILLSGFWSLANEVFDPREAKLQFGRIAGLGTAGGIAGGLLAERVAAMFGAPALLLLLAVFHILCAGVLGFFRERVGVEREPEVEGAASTVGQIFSRTPVLWGLGALVLLGTMSAAMLDFLFKSGATQAIGKGASLVRFFAGYYAGTQILTFLVQYLFTRSALQKFGLAHTVLALPLVVAAGATGSLLAPIFPMIASARGLELIFRGSLFRSGYELFFTPFPPREKRAVKTLIDVACDRAGDAVGAIALQLIILLQPDLARMEILITTIMLAGLAAWIALRLNTAYVKVLERGLANRAVELEMIDMQDSAPLSMLLRTTLPGELGTTSPTPGAKLAGPQITARHEADRRANQDEVTERFQELRCGDAERVRAALAPENPFEPLLVPQVIRLLAWDEVSTEARAMLERGEASIAGQLIDGLFDEHQDFAIRRRIPRILGRLGTQTAVYGLMQGLKDTRFEVRFQCGRALDYLRMTQPDLKFDAEAIYRVVDKELSVSRRIWEGRRLLDRRESDDSLTFLDDLVRERADQSLEHVFSLLAVLLPREPLRTAFRAVHSEDRLLRGLGLEYLESVLPSGTREKLWHVIDAAPISESARNPEEVLRQLMLSNESLVLPLKKPSSAEPPTASTQSTAKES